jgi:hypothetical protein
VHALSAAFVYVNAIDRACAGRSATLPGDKSGPTHGHGVVLGHHAGFFA